MPTSPTSSPSAYPSSLRFGGPCATSARWTHAPRGAVYGDVGNAQWGQWFVEDLAKMLVEILRLAGPAAAQVLRARRRRTLTGAPTRASSA